MLKKVLDLLIAVTFVYAVEAIFSMFSNSTSNNTVSLSFYLSFNILSDIEWPDFLAYFIPAGALIIHVAQVAQYHQKREDWKIEDEIGLKLEGIWEAIQITFITIPVICLILVSRFLTLNINRERIIYLWMATYICYFIVDLAVKKKFKLKNKLPKVLDDDSAAEKKKKAMERAVITLYRSDLFVAVVCLIAVCIGTTGHVSKIWIFEKYSDFGVAIISLIIIIVTIVISVICKDLLFKEKPNI